MRKSLTEVPLNKAAKDLLICILGIDQVKQMLEAEEIIITGFILNNNTAHKIYYQILDAFKSKEEKEELLKKDGTHVAEKKKLRDEIVKLNIRLGLPGDYPAIKLEGNYTMEELYLKDEISKRLYRCFKRANIYTLHHLADWSMKDLTVLHGLKNKENKLMKEISKLREKYKV